MAKAPTVQTLDQIMAELQPGYTGQRKVIAKGIQNTNETYKASELALDAAKTQGFNQINTQATGKGTTFSGISADEQADYLSTKYLPGKQAAKAQQQADILTLEGQNAALDTDIRNRAQAIRDNQVSSVNAWNLQQAQIEATARENAAVARSSGGGGAGSAPMGGAAGVRAFLLKNANPQTGKVNPSVWAAAVDLASQGGMSFGGDQGFANTFWSFADDGAWQKYKLGYDKYMK